MFVAMVDIVLKDQKKDDFKTWISESNRVLSKFDGFISIELGENCREPEIHLTKARDYLRDVIKEKDYSN